MSEFKKVLGFPVSSGFQAKQAEERDVRVGDLTIVWEGAQRPLNEKFVAKITDDFNCDLFGIPDVIELAGEAKMHIADGQHRIEAARRIFGDGCVIRCLVHTAKSPAQAADLFLMINSRRRPVRALDRFRVSVTARNEEACGIARVVNEANYRVGAAGTARSIGCVSELQHLYRRYGSSRLARALNVISHTFGDDHLAVSGPMIGGYVLFIAENPDYERERLIETVAKNFNAAKLLGHAKGRRELMGARTSHADAVKAVLSDTYHGSRRKRR